MPKTKMCTIMIILKLVYYQKNKIHMKKQKRNIAFLDETSNFLTSKVA